MDFIRYYHNVICDGLWPYFKQKEQSSPCFLCSQRVYGDLVLGNEIYTDAFVFWKREQRPLVVLSGSSWSLEHYVGLNKNAIFILVCPSVPHRCWKPGVRLHRASETSGFQCGWSCFLMWDLKSKMILLIFTALSQSWGEHFTAVAGLFF